MKVKADLDTLTKAFLISGLVFLTVMLLVYGAGIFVPLAIALLIWFLINAVARGYQRLGVGTFRIPRRVAMLLSIVTMFVVSFYVVDMVVRNLTALSTGSIDFEKALNPWIDKIAEWADLSNKEVLNQIFDRIGIEQLLTRIVSAMTGFASQLGVILVYVIFMLVEQQFFDAKLNALVKNDERREMIRGVLARIARHIQSYLWIMTFVSGMTAALSYGVMIWIGLDQPGFWAFLIFVLNFIPTIGSILATGMPALFALVQFQDFGPVLTLLVLIGAIQFAIGNFLQPRLAGQTLNMSQFVVILSLFVWGAVWGVTGMFLAVPMTAILIIILSNFETTRPVAILMSQEGNIEPSGEEAPSSSG